MPYTTSSSSPFLQACAGQVPSRKPIWLMRQAGRILPAYRQLRSQYQSVSELFDSPELASRITLMPVEQLGVDAAILFTDLVTPLKALGVHYQYQPGPVLERPIRHRSDMQTLTARSLDASLDHVLETVRRVRAGLPPEVALIGYAGAPFTLAAWLVEGQATRDLSVLRRLLFCNPVLAHELLERLAVLAAEFLQAQIEAGAQAVQLFDTSVGMLGPVHFREFALPYVCRVFEQLDTAGVPRMYFPLAAPHLLPWLPPSGADVLSLDWRTPLDTLYARLDPAFPLQGNLDPCALFAPVAQLDQAIDAVLASAADRPHIFNLGHGVLPDTPLAQVRRLVERVHKSGTGAAGNQTPELSGDAAHG